MPIPSYRQQQQQVQAAVRPAEPEYTEADWDEAGAAQHRRRPVMFIVFGLLLGGGGIAMGVNVFDSGASGFELLAYVWLQLIGAVFLLIGIIGKGVQIGMTSDRHRD